VKYDKVQFLEYVELFKKTKDTHWAEEAASLHDSGYFAEEAWSWAIESTENLRTQYEKLVSDIAASRS
jgi:two-component SAPR family response regulator